LGRRNGRLRMGVLPGFFEFFRGGFEVGGERIVDGSFFGDFGKQVSLSCGQEFRKPGLVLLHLFDGHLVDVTFLNGPKDSDLHLNGHRFVLGLLKDFGDSPPAIDLGLSLWVEV
jgi:hypothetical protein